MATGKVRIFELAKEAGLSSKELIVLFNERLGGVFEAKNQLSVVPEQIADLVRSVLLKPTAHAAPKASPPPAPPSAPVPPAAAPPQPEEAAPSAPAAPVPRLRPVSTSSRPPAAPKAPPK